jgi:hypothetical protein
MAVPAQLPTLLWIPPNDVVRPSYDPGSLQRTQLTVELFRIGILTQLVVSNGDVIAAFSAMRR